MAGAEVRTPSTSLETHAMPPCLQASMHAGAFSKILHKVFFFKKKKPPKFKLRKGLQFLITEIDPGAKHNTK